MSQQGRHNRTERRQLQGLICICLKDLGFTVQQTIQKHRIKLYMGLGLISEYLQTAVLKRFK